MTSFQVEQNVFSAYPPQLHAWHGQIE